MGIWNLACVVSGMLTFLISRYTMPAMRMPGEYTLPDMLYAFLFYRSHGVCHSDQIKSPQKDNPGAMIPCIRQETV
jgi:hypothetical protein